MDKEKCMLSFSPKQKCFHIENIDQYLSANMNRLISNKEPCYFGIFIGTHGECSRYISKIRKTFDKIYPREGE